MSICSIGEYWVGVQPEIRIRLTLPGGYDQELLEMDPPENALMFKIQAKYLSIKILTIGLRN